MDFVHEICVENSGNNSAIEINKIINYNVFLFLVGSRKAMPTGGELLLQTDNVALDKDFVKAYRVKSGKYVKVSIKDSGIGINNLLH